MLVDKILAGFIRIGTLTVRYPDGQERRYGGKIPGPSAGLHLRTPQIVRRVLLNPSLSLGEGFMEGSAEPLGCSIYDLLDVLYLNLEEGGRHPMERVMAGWRMAVRHLHQMNPASRSKQNVAHHYDLNGRLYSLFLDRDRQYSCAYFPTGTETLEEAQTLKKRHIASKLRLDRPDLEVLDIGCGWGGMAISLAKEWGARVTGITLSEEQLAVARQRAKEEGLEDRVKFELVDYRSWKRPVDRIVSVGMFEHVGIDYYKQFFNIVRQALKPDGVALIHAIGRKDGPGSTNPWLEKYIFPGGYSPALSEVLPAVEKAGLWSTDIEILRLHYAETLRHWRRRFAANRDAILALYDERFCRMFEYYLAGSELAFRRGDHMNWQIQLTRKVDTLPMARDYMLDAERAKTREMATTTERQDA